jgi:hypothetical protein
LARRLAAGEPSGKPCAHQHRTQQRMGLQQETD